MKRPSNQETNQPTNQPTDRLTKRRNSGQLWRTWESTNWNSDLPALSLGFGCDSRLSPSGICLSVAHNKKGFRFGCQITCTTGSVQTVMLSSVQFNSAQSSVLPSFQAAHIAANLLLSHNLHCPMGENNVTKCCKREQGGNQRKGARPAIKAHRHNQLQIATILVKCRLYSQLIFPFDWGQPLTKAYRRELDSEILWLCEGQAHRHTHTNTHNDGYTLPIWARDNC